MNDDDFEWDDAKAAANYAKHGVSFGRARLAFSDPFGIGAYDDRDDYGEDRFTRVAWSKGCCCSCPTRSAAIMFG
jgi:uncharacterized protein